MKVGYACRWDPRDKRSWSGTSYHTWKQISRNHPVEIFTFRWPWYLRERLTTLKSINRRLFGKQTSVEFMNAYARYFSQQLDKALQERPVDVLFVSASPQLFAYSKTNIPVVFMTDATFHQIKGYYPYFSNLSAGNIRQGTELDKRAFLRADHCMLGSVWNRDSAVADYGMDPATISIVPFGANLESIPGREALDLTARSSCRLLFLGVDWERKGGPIAMDTLRILKARGLPAMLTIVGCDPPPGYDAGLPEGSVQVMPFLDKNDPLDAAMLHRLLMDTDLLLLPTRAECAGVVFSEAAAYGIPSITTDTGGVTTYVREGINGFALPLSAAANDYANRILSLLQDREAYGRLRKDTRQLYEQELNWDQWGKAFEIIAARCLKPNDQH